MKKNVGKTDKIVRVVLGIILIGLALFVVKGVLAIVFGVAALVMIVTAAMGSCPAYIPFKMNTCEKE